ncbi:MAG: ATP-binding protein [Myxococcales bacterium]|nr:ATP-binding protein [Myxococcales bacterium]
MPTSRFERKLLLALVAVAVVPMIGAIVFGQAALREAYEVGVNPHVGNQLEEGLSLYRQHFTELRKHADHLALAVANDYELVPAAIAGNVNAMRERLAQLKAMYPAVARMSVHRSGQLLAQSGPGLAVSSETRRLHLERPLGDSGSRVRITVDAPVALMAAYQQAGELSEVFARLEKGGGEVSNYYLLVYMGFLVGVIAIAIVVGVVLSRRVTRRVALLAAATARVGAGDLDVQVPTDVKDEVGELTRAFNAMVRDIRESRDRIEYLQRIGAWQEFARRLAHEIKNPLTPIQLAVQELERSYDGAEGRFASQLRDAAAIVQEEVATLRRLVSEFSEFARMPEAQLEPASLRAVLAEMQRSLEHLSDQYPLPDGRVAGKVRCHRPAEPLPVLVDAMMLRRGIDNLVRNALQALRDAGREGRVEITAERMGGRVLLRVSDDGPGVPELERARIFDPYVTTKADGTGLGLAIAKKVVFEHQGEIACRTSRWGGAEFEIRLPLRPSPPVVTGA